MDVARVERLEDLETWKRARELAREVYLASGRGSFAQDFALRDQIRRAAISVVSNIAEGFERGGDAEFRQFLTQARASAGEVRAQLYIALDVGHIDQAQFARICNLAVETGKLAGGLIAYLSRSNLRGSKFREDAVQYTIDV